MRPKQRIRKIYTQSDIAQRPCQLDENVIKNSNINIKDLQLNINDSNKNASDSKSNHNFIYKNTHFYMPNKFNKINRKQLIKKLPEINLTSLNNISRPVKLSPLDERNEDRSTNNKKNTFHLNSLFQILKPQETNDSSDIYRVKEKTIKLGQNRNVSIDSYYENQFINVTNSTTKNRGPKIIENEITRLSNHNNIMRRKIVSQQKSRPKFCDQSIQKLKQTTFQQFKRCVKRQEETDLTQSQNPPKQSFQNLQIITFYNKFPTLKKKQQQKQVRVQKKEAKDKIQLRPTYKQFMNKTKTQMPECDQQNQFIFQKK